MSSLIITGTPLAAAQAASQNDMIYAGRLLDVKTDTTLPDQVIVSEGEKIAAAGSAKSLKAP